MKSATCLHCAKSPCECSIEARVARMGTGRAKNPRYVRNAPQEVRNESPAPQELRKPHEYGDEELAAEISRLDGRLKALRAERRKRKDRERKK